MTAHTALLCRVAEIKMYKVIKVADACVFIPYIILYICIKAVNKKVLVLFNSHIKLAFGLITKGAKAGDKLKIAEALRSEILVNSLSMH